MNKYKFQYILAVVLYGTIGLLLHWVDLPSSTAAFYRGLLGTLTIAGILLLRRHRPNWTAIRRNLPLLLLSGACLGLNWVFLFAAYRATTVAIASLCNYTAPVISLVILSVIHRKKPELPTAICVLAAAVGIVFVSGVLEAGQSAATPKGIALGMASALCFVVIVLCNRQFRNLHAFDKALIQLLIATVVMLPCTAVEQHGIPLPPDLRSLVLVVLLGVLQTGVAYIFYFEGLANISVESIAILGYLEPVVSILTSVLILREKTTILGMAGAVLILGAALWNELRQARLLLNPEQQRRCL